MGFTPTIWGPSLDLLGTFLGPLFFPQGSSSSATNYHRRHPSIVTLPNASYCRQPMALNHDCEIFYISTSPLPPQPRSSQWSTLASLLPLFSLFSLLLFAVRSCPSSRYLTTPCWTSRLSLLLQQLPLSLLVLKPVSWLSVMESQRNLPAPPRSNPSSMPDVSLTRAAPRACFTLPDSRLKT